jgi:hypothetical protein
MEEEREGFDDVRSGGEGQAAREKDRGFVCSTSLTAAGEDWDGMGERDGPGRSTPFFRAVGWRGLATRLCGTYVHMDVVLSF